MKTLDALLVASTLALGACPEPTPTCDRGCENIIAIVASRAQIALSNIDRLCRTTVSAYVTNCMVKSGSEEALVLPGDVCMDMAVEQLKQCTRK